MTINHMSLIYAKKKPMFESCLKVEEEDLESLWQGDSGT